MEEFFSRVRNNAFSLKMERTSDFKDYEWNGCWSEFEEENVIFGWEFQRELQKLERWKWVR